MDITSVNSTNINLFEAFSGIGSQHLALNNISKAKNWNINVVGIVEWFIDAIVAYESIHHPTNKVKKQTFKSDVNLSADSKNPLSAKRQHAIFQNSETSFWLNRSKELSKNLFDITKVNADDFPKNIDIFTYSFPCQDLSGQGLGKGMDQKSNTRSGLLWEIDRILFSVKDIFKSDEMPKYLLLENVKSMINKNHISQFQKWLDRLEELGYESKQYILNSKDFGMAQSRERVFVLSVLKTHKEKVGFKFSEIKTKNSIVPIKNILEDNVPIEKKFNQYKLKGPSTRNPNVRKYMLENYTNFSSENMVFDINYNGSTLTASGALSRIKLYYGENKIRTMTPRESFKYMGFKDSDYDKVVNTKLISPTRQIYLAGNSIVVKVLEEIFRTLVF